MTRSEWIQVVVLATTMITAIWWFGRNTVTREDLAAFEQEMRLENRELRAHVDAQTQELRAHVDAQTQELRAEMQELRAYVNAEMQELRAQMRELRGYIVDHLDGHPVD